MRIALAGLIGEATVQESIIPARVYPERPHSVRGTLTGHRAETKTLRPVGKFNDLQISAVA